MGGARFYPQNINLEIVDETSTEIQSKEDFEGGYDFGARRGGSLSKGDKLLLAMMRNPAGDWRISDVEVVCRQYGLTCRPPTGGGSHHRVSHPKLFEILTIPARRPIKPIYIKQLVAYVARATGPANDP